MFCAFVSKIIISICVTIVRKTTLDDAKLLLSIIHLFFSSSPSSSCLSQQSFLMPLQSIRYHCHTQILPLCVRLRFLLGSLPFLWFVSCFSFLHSHSLTHSPTIRNSMFIMGFVWMCINPSQARKKPAIIHCHLFRAKHLKRMPFNRVSTRTHNSCDQPFLVDETAATNIISALFFLLLYLFGDFVFSFNMIVDRLLLLYSSFFLLQSTPALPHLFLHRFMQTVISLK